MSFTAEVRDELARCEPECEYCDLSTLAALTRVSGTLSLTGSGRYRLTVATETGAVARTMITLTHRILKLKTEFTVRKSVLHKVRNYLITLPDQPDLDKALVLLGILDRRGGLVAGVPRHIVCRVTLSPVLAVDLPISAARSLRAASWPIHAAIFIWRSLCRASNMPRGSAICWSRLGSMRVLMHGGGHMPCTLRAPRKSSIY